MGNDELLLESLVIGGFGNIVDKVNCFAAFGSSVIVSHPYNTAFYNVDNRGKVGICEQNPHSSLHDHGSFAVNVSIVTRSPYSASDTDMVILCKTSTNIIVNLPPAQDCVGRIYVIKKVTNDPGTVTINPAVGSGDMIDDAPNYVINIYNESVQIVAFYDNDVTPPVHGWKIINR